MVSTRGFANFKTIHVEMIAQLPHLNRKVKFNTITLDTQDVMNEREKEARYGE